MIIGRKFIPKHLYIRVPRDDSMIGVIEFVFIIGLQLYTRRDHIRHVNTRWKALKLMINKFPTFYQTRRFIGVFVCKPATRPSPATIYLNSHPHSYFLNFYFNNIPPFTQVFLVVVIRMLRWTFLVCWGVLDTHDFSEVGSSSRIWLNMYYKTCSFGSVRSSCSLSPPVPSGFPTNILYVFIISSSLLYFLFYLIAWLSVCRTCTEEERLIRRN